MQIAATMARTHVPLVAVIERDRADGRGRLLGVVSAAALMRHLLEAGGPA
jgi:CBS domain-containing protein